MKNGCVYILKLSESRRYFLEHGISYSPHPAGGVFSESVSEETFKRLNPALVLIAFESAKVDYLGRAKRGGSGGTGNRLLRCSQLYELPSGVPMVDSQTDGEPPRSIGMSFRDLIDETEARFQSHVKAKLESGGIVQPKTSEALIRALTRLCPSLASVLEEFSGSWARGLSKERRGRMALERDSVGLALRFAGFPTGTITNRRIRDEDGSFLSTLKEFRAREDNLILHDLHKIPGGTLLEKSPWVLGAAVFEARDCRVTVVHANKQPLETTLGVDLIYFNETYKSFVMVQYKVYDDDDRFRLPDQMLEEEIIRMNGIRNGLPPTDVKDVCCIDLRLNEDPFFLKFCSRKKLLERESDLISGQYVPLHAWPTIERASESRGSKGGRLIVKNALKRHLTPSLFIEGVKQGWIGTRSAQSALLQDLITNALTTGKPTMLAIRTETAEDDGPDSGFGSESAI